MKIPNSRAGFTLVELMVAIAIVGIVSIVILNIFDTTSQNYYEVNQLADLNGRIRFANETLRNHLQGAGSQGSPDSLNDPRVHPKQPGVRVAGLIPYDGWQNDRSVLPADIAANNPEVSFDGIVVVGAFDFPLSFEFAGMQDGPPRNGRIYADKRGIFKLTSQDLFDPTITPPTLDQSTHIDPMTSQWRTRILRLADRQGFYQFVGFNGVPADPGSYDDDTHPYVLVPMVVDTDPLAPRFKGTAASGGTLDYGLDVGDGDIAYDAGLLDAFWFHVEPSISDPNVMTLVRERICADDVALNALSGTWDPSTALAPTCGGTAEKVVLASHVADFQVWFDCADTVDGAVRSNDWDSAWDPNDHSADCMNDTAPDPGNVRGGHIRLALHTATEREDQAHIQFEDAAGAVCNTVAPFTCSPARMASATLRTYDLYTDTVGAARVVVMQSDFEIVNLVNRNVVAP